MRGGVLVLLALLAAPPWLPADSSSGAPPPETERLRRDLDRIRREIEEETRKREEALRREKSALSRLEALDRRLERLRRERDANRRDLQETRRRLRELERRMREVSEALEEGRRALRQRLAALQKHGPPNPLLVLGLGEKGTAEAAREFKFQLLLARSNEKLLSRILSHRRALEDSSRRFAEEERRRERILSALERQEVSVRSQHRERERLVASLRREAKSREETIRELTEAARNLADKVEELLSASRSDPAVPGPWNGPGLASLRGRLPWPVKGTVTSPFGRHRHPEFNAVMENTGVQIRAPRGTPIRAVSGGLVRFANWFKGYGKLVILDHGKGYYSLYAHASELYVAPGQVVSAGEILGAVGDTGSLVGESLYFEIRKNGIPVDPAGYLGKHP